MVEVRQARVRVLGKEGIQRVRRWARSGKERAGRVERVVGS